MKFVVIIHAGVPKLSKKYLTESQLQKPDEFFRKGKIYRFRIGDYRVFYTILWNKRVVVITDIRRRECIEINPDRHPF